MQGHHSSLPTRTDMVDWALFIATWLLSLLNVTTFLFLWNQGLNLDSVSGITVLEKINGKQYILSDTQLPYLTTPAGCASINASPAFFDTNADFVVLRTRLQSAEFHSYDSIWVNITQVGAGDDAHYFWEKEEVSASLWWSEEPNKQGTDCEIKSDICRPVQMTYYRGQSISDTHYLMDTCCLYPRYFFCEDIDECDQRGLCPAMSQCFNSPGSYHCQCNPGYQLNGSGLCQDIDECHKDGQQSCSENTQFLNNVANPICGPLSGIQPASTNCQGISKCNSTGTFNCTTNSYCSNIPGSYICLCNPGYAMNSTVCQDIDECKSTGTFTCPKNSKCNNTPGNYNCSCDNGYQMNNSVCEDVDECKRTGTFTCPTNSNCSNTPGSYICLCNEGYEMTNTVCEDIDECNSTGTFICSTNSNCSNTHGSYICICNEGYEMNNTECQDIDECNSTGTFTCPTNSNCSNTVGSYVCLCNEGYEMNSTECQDIDECNGTGTFTCPTNSNCSNTYGSYICLCNEGYEMNNTECQDLDECSNGLEICPANSFCVNTESSFHCVCQEGFFWTNQTCQEVPGQLLIMKTSPVSPVRLGATVILFCQISNNNFTQTSTTIYHWLKDGVDLQNSDASLRLDNVTRDDEGGFQCYITDGTNMELSRSIPFVLTLIVDNHPVSDQTTIKCPCRYGNDLDFNHTQEPTVDNTDHSIQVDTLSSYIRARTSATDVRVVSVITGSTAVAVLVCLLFVTVAVDVLTFMF